MAKVSIIVPVYNVEKYLECCLESLINQTLKDIEIICVNDGSTDNSSKILDNYAATDSRIKVISQPNKGMSEARNSGLKIATGEYISFVDSDDWVDLDFIEKLYDAAERNDADIAVGGMKRQREKSFKYRLNFIEEKVYTNLQEKLDVCRIPDCCYACGKLFKMDLIKNRPFKKGVYFEDVIWTPYVIKDSTILITVPNTYYFYRVNHSSIVKSIQSEKKQHDSYIAKKGIVEFYRKNNLKLKKKYNFVTKKIKYLGKVPILKIKEYDNKETFYLFGFLHIKTRKNNTNFKYINIKKFFFFKNIDAHFYIELFKSIKISFKNSAKFDYKEAKGYGLTNEKRKPQLIVSLTSFPARIPTIDKTINTLLSQTIKPDRLILWLAEEQFPNKEKDLTQKLIELKEKGLEIRWCEDLRSYKKLVPALKEFPEDIIVTADDDLYYQQDWLESLYSEYLQNPFCICTRRACGVKFKNNIFKVSPHYANSNFKPTFLNQLMGGAGTLYPPHSLHEDVFNVEQIKTLIPTHDDIYFWIMAILNGTKIKLVKNKDVSFYAVKGTQESGLCKANNEAQTVGMSPAKAFEKILEKYPQAYEVLEKESIKIL